MMEIDYTAASSQPCSTSWLAWRPHFVTRSPRLHHDGAFDLWVATMTTGMRIIEGAYCRDILDQPRALAETHRGLERTAALDGVARRLRDGDLRGVVLTGMGSSYLGLAPLHLRLVEAGLAPVCVESSELLHYQRRLLCAGSLLVVVSQSGRSAEVVRLLETVRGRGVVTIGLTNTADSPLAREATATVLTRAGEEATVSCKTYVAAQMALAWLGEVLAGGNRDATRAALGETIAATATYLASWRSHVRWLGGQLPGVRAVYYTGRGPSLAAACSAGLITKESTHRPSEGMSSAAFRHGPMEMLDEAVFLLAFAGAACTRALNEALVADVRAAGARAFLAAEDATQPALRLPAVPEVARPVVELLPVEMITLALAALDGREAGRFDRVTKITATE
jgi:glucosamine--fructose-6-phosphate aminotransferase (isomerizing)